MVLEVVHISKVKICSLEKIEVFEIMVIVMLKQWIINDSHNMDPLLFL
jgi:hypothetical protein